ncbi:Creatininase [uncultured delta proteobacterium]|uniref:Creatininase n=1 Tax=uncultured delta proteobacterium TaxID=34034 RepID=A0A212KCQ9_9DELT|nr:Creatininase [uncultured delta proteobacterium]
MKKTALNEFSTRELREMLAAGKIDSAIAVFGSCESHGDHMPLGPDLFVPEAVARRAAERLEKTIVLPGIPFGTSLHYNAFPLAISLRFETTQAVAEDILESLITSGIKHILIFNGHDGNIPALEIAGRKVKNRHPEAVILFLPAWWNLLDARLPGLFEVWQGLGHGGEGETSITMAVKPDLVDISFAKRQMPEDLLKMGLDGNTLWDIAEVSATGATGDPTKATTAKGEKMLDALVDIVVGMIRAMERNTWAYDCRKEPRDVAE